MYKVRPIKCSRCGEFFLCRGRVNPEDYLTKKCIDKKECQCENCNKANRGDNECGNFPLTFNPSRRNTWEWGTYLNF